MQRKKNYVIIAKSAGAVLAAIEIEKNNITPSIFVVLGLPLKFTFENRIKIKEILNNINNRCKILIIQQKFDPQGSVKEVFDLLGKNIRIKPINGNKHTYANWDKVIGRCEFEETENVWNIIHTKVNESYQGQGIAKQLVLEVISNAKTQKKKVVADCSYAKKVLEKEKKFKI